ncbi:MAG TPA: VWA domain-containing protein [Thermoanaerobaculia bacterium]|jgi:Ca-activated chloride channel family protein|nr:VWA domain-containing protein [Thermoanaerobaculia bacterium]
MKSRALPSVLAALVAVLAAASPASPLLAQARETEISTAAGKFPLYVTAEYLGMVGLKTVLRVRLRAPELSMAAAKRGLKSFLGELQGSFLKGDDVVQAFRYPVSGEVGDRTTFAYAFLRSIEPGTYKLKLVLTAPGGRDLGESTIELAVPEVGAKFSPEMAPAEASTMPAAEAIVLADEAAEAATPGESKLKILPPARETPIGLLRLEADVSPPITRVEFYLEDKLIVRRTRPPYSVEIDLGEVPRKQTVRAVGYDSNGRVIDEDAWSINQGSARLAVKILPTADAPGGAVRVKVAVQSIGGGVARQVELFLGDKKLKTWTNSGPYDVSIPFGEYSKAEYLRATAIAEDGKEANDIRFLKGPNTTIESVRVDIVQLHISALDKDNRFVKGLAETDFSVQEDGRAQKVTGFEIAEKLPLTIGLVVDGSGSMEKSMPFVHDASSELFRGLIRDKDKGFVIEFREQPHMIQELTGDSAALQRASRETSARGATALYDSIVLGLYQFRTLQGRKALIVVTDGADNHSHVDFPTLLRYARSGGAPIYFIGVGISVIDFGIRKEVNEIAHESGGEVFHISSAAKIGDVTKRIEEELRSQYILAFRTDSQKPDGEYRTVAVSVAKPGVTARTIKGYIP